MAIHTQEQARIQISTLIENYHTLKDPDLQSEANVRANFIDPLFEALNWPINDPAYYNREEYVRTVGFADISLRIKSTTKSPLLFVEAKRLGSIEPLARIQDRRNQNAAELRIKLPGMSVDRTREEQQAINYAYQRGMRWAVLTNFEHFRLFNARRDTLVLSFDSPRELIERFDELWQLSFTEVKQGSLASLRAHRERLDIDEEYLRLINTWRLRLGQDIISHRENLILLEDPYTRKIDIHKLRDAVQRILDRLVIIRHAEDRLVIKVDQLQATVELRDRCDYSIPLLEQIRYFFQEFNVRHNGSLFTEHLCDQLTVSEDVLKAIITNLYDARFRSMSADIMGNTYEQYLGQTLTVKNGDVDVVDNLETRKAQGSYYTPEYVVRYIVDQTVGRYLYGTYNGRSDGKPIPGEQRKQLEDIDGSNGNPSLTILDSSCGSGSFLMNVYHVLETFYASAIADIQRERERRFKELSGTGISHLDLQIELADSKQKLDALHNYKNQILEKHIYGVDLDPQAAELAAVNLMLRAMSRGIRLPLILNQNIKVGNSILSGVQIRDEQTIQEIIPLASQLAELRRIRLEQQGDAQHKSHSIELQVQYERLAQDVNATLNEKLSVYFGEKWGEKRPFNWIVEFPEIFLNEDGNLRENAGFTFVIGNPPYLSVDDTWGKSSPDAAYVKEAFADIWAGKSDMYYYFIRRALTLLSPQGQMGFITARYYLEAYYAQKIRQVMLQEASLKQIVDFGDYPVFPKVGTKTNITLLQREPNKQSRTNNTFAFNKANRKQRDILQFLTDFRQSSHSFPQSSLSHNSWNLSEQNISRIITTMDTDAELLGDLTFIGQGMQTGRNPVFVIDKKTIDRYQIEPELIRKNIKNQDIKRYSLAFRGLYLIYTEEIENMDDYPRAKAYLEEHRATLEKRAAFQRGDCEWWRFTWPLHKEKYSTPKLTVPFIAPENRFALDRSMEYIGLTDTYAIFPTEQSPDLRYLLALLNSKLLNFRFRYIGKAKDYRYEYVKNGLEKIPIKTATAKVEQTLITLAQRMIDLNFMRQLLHKEFQETLTATVHTRHRFEEAYYDHGEYRVDILYRVGSANASAQGTVTSITVCDKDSQLQFYITEKDGGELPLISLKTTDTEFRLFLFLAIRTYLLANERKQIWSRGYILSGALRAIMVPVLDETAASSNIEQIHQFMDELRHRISREINKVSPDLISSVNDVLDLGSIEAELQRTDQRIDDLVFQLYGIESREDIQFIQDTLG